MLSTQLRLSPVRCHALMLTARSALDPGLESLSAVRKPGVGHGAREQVSSRTSHAAGVRAVAAHEKRGQNVTGRSGGGSQSPCPRKSAAGEQPSILERAAEPGAGARGSSAGDSSRQYMREPARRHVAVHHPSDFFPLGECMHKPARRHVAVLHPSGRLREKKWTIGGWYILRGPHHVT